jgi:hypothetical protein
MGHLLYVSLKELIERIWQQIKGSPIKNLNYKLDRMNWRGGMKY